MANLAIFSLVSLTFPIIPDASGKVEKCRGMLVTVLVGYAGKKSDLNSDKSRQMQHILAVATCLDLLRFAEIWGVVPRFAKIWSRFVEICLDLALYYNHRVQISC